VTSGPDADVCEREQRGRRAEEKEMNKELATASLFLPMLYILF
jgi:hypothetical protein